MYSSTSARTRRYALGELFTYTGVPKWRIGYRLFLLALYKLLRVRHVTAPVNTYSMQLDLKTPGLSSVLFVYGTRELPDTSIVQTVLKPGMVVADIGANIGYYTLLEAQQVGPDGHIYAFEPDPRNVPLLKKNIALNHFTDRVSVYEQAVADTTQIKDFGLGTRTNVSSFVDRPDVVDAVPVSCIALPEFEYIDQVDMLRMDAEGYECKIIEGVIPYLRDHTRPFSILLEVHPKEYNKTDLNFEVQLQQLFMLGFSAAYVVANAINLKAYQARGYQPASTWQETRHERMIYTNVANDDVLALLRENKMRAMHLVRN